jgi:hypothetical protein
MNSFEMPLKQWCAKNELFSKKPYTHTFLDKGVIGLDDALIPEFLKCYAWNLKYNKDISISEMRSKIFRFFIDIDFELTFELDKNQVLNLVEGIQKIINDVIKPIDQLYCIVSQSAPKIIDEVKIKNGIHIVWPRMYTDQLGARKLRDIIVQKMVLENSIHNWESVINDTPDWESVIDESVYVNSGLRMMFSYKAEKCKECRKKTKTTLCSICINKGFIYSRPYLPSFVLDSSGELDVERTKSLCITSPSINEMIKILAKSSIRSQNTKQSLLFSEPLPSWYKPSKFLLNKISHKKQPAMYMNDPSLIEETKMNCNNNDEHIDRFDERYIQVQNFIRSMWHPYAALNINSFIKKKKRNHYYYCLRTDQHFCHNIGREHSSNHIWLTIDPDTRSIMQRCFDNECNNYITRAESLKLNESLFTLLYPELSDRLNKNKKKIIPKSLIRNKTINDIFENDDLF